MTRGSPAFAAAGLVGLAALHAAWGAGASFPAPDREELADLIAGTEAVPPARQCLAVAGLLATAASLVASIGPWPPAVRRAGVVGVVGVLGARGIAGLTGRTDLLVPWTPSARFVGLDRRYYGPLCLALAVGASTSLYP